MAYREVTMLCGCGWAGPTKKRIAAQLGLDVKTVRRYIAAAEAIGLTREAGPDGLDDGPGLPPWSARSSRARGGPTAAAWPTVSPSARSSRATSARGSGFRRFAPSCGAKGWT